MINDNSREIKTEDPKTNNPVIHEPIIQNIPSSIINSKNSEQLHDVPKENFLLSNERKGSILTKVIYKLL